jgi:hypothetical protein
MVRRHVEATPYEFVCFTDDVRGIDAQVRIATLPCAYPGWWSKVGLFQGRIPGIRTDKIFFIDLDVVITGALDPMLRLAVNFAVCKDWPDEIRPGNRDINTSAFLLAVGSHVAVWDGFSEHCRSHYPTDQEYIGARIPPDRRHLFPYDWTPSYKLRKLEKSVPSAARVVLFHGEPKPHQCGGWVKEKWI